MLKNLMSTLKNMFTTVDTPTLESYIMANEPKDSNDVERLEKEFSLKQKGYSVTAGYNF